MRFDYSRFAFFLIILFLTRLGIDVSGGEDHYLSYAKYWWNPDWIPNSFILQEFAGTRLLFQYLTGPLLEHVSISTSALILRGLNFLGFAYALTVLTQSLNLPRLFAVVSFTLFLIGRQSLFGGEWIFVSVEPKTFAYVFLLLAVNAYLRERYITMTVFLVLATYFHFLIGAWFFIYVGALLISKSLRSLLRVVCLSSVLLGPFIWYLYQGYFSTFSDCAHNMSHVYNYYRIPHHTGLFQSLDYFLDIHVLGVLGSFVLLLLLLFARRQLQGDRLWPPLVRLTVMILSFNLLFVLAAAIDAYGCNQAGSALITYYPFRSNSIALLFSYFIMARFASVWISRTQYGDLLKKLLIFMLLVIACFRTLDNARKSVEAMKSNSLNPMAEYIKEHTPRDAVFAFAKMPASRAESPKFIRTANREMFALKKFVPATSNKRCEWYERQLLQASLMEDYQLIFSQEMSKYKLDFLVLGEFVDDARLSLIYSNEHFYLYSLP